MSAPTLDTFSPTVVDAGERTRSTVRAARVCFCDREDAEMFLEWLRVRSEALGSDITFPLFVCTAADAYSVSSALTCALFGDSDLGELPENVASEVASSTLPAVFAPYSTAEGWEVAFVISRR